MSTRGHGAHIGGAGRGRRGNPRRAFAQVPLSRGIDESGRSPSAAATARGLQNHDRRALCIQRTRRHPRPPRAALLPGSHARDPGDPKRNVWAMEAPSDRLLSDPARWTSSSARTGKEDSAKLRPKSTAACAIYPSPSTVAASARPTMSDRSPAVADGVAAGRGRQADRTRRREQRSSTRRGWWCPPASGRRRSAGARTRTTPARRSRSSPARTCPRRCASSRPPSSAPTPSTPAPSARRATPAGRPLRSRPRPTPAWTRMPASIPGAGAPRGARPPARHRETRTLAGRGHSGDGGGAAGHGRSGPAGGAACSPAEAGTP
jgi:hypothetical protein